MRRVEHALCTTGAILMLLISACGSPASPPDRNAGTATVAAQPTALAPSTAPPAIQPASPTSTAEPDSVFMPPPGSRGAAVLWVEYEAEAGETNGAILEPSRRFGEIAAESSGRQSVRLEEAGQYVAFTTIEPANSVVVRFAIPDAEQGGGITATLSLYVDDTFRQPLVLTSRYAWSYGGETGTSNDPGLGGPHHFFDEARALVGDIPTGAIVKLQKDDADSAAYYVIDLIDLEQVGPPKTMPENFASVTDCGAMPDDGSDDGRAIQQCIELARMRGQGVWIPPGVFESLVPLADSQGISVAGVTIRGAGMWHSTIHGPYARFWCVSSNCRYYDFALLGETTLRDDAVPENGFNGGAGTGSRMENVWVEHTKVGWWVGAGDQNVTNGLVITGSRFRNLFADGVNFCNGTSSSVVENSHFRNTGDDALASWTPAQDKGINTGNVFRFNTVQLPWRANCFAIYGGRDQRIEDSTCADVVTYPGVLIAQDFDSHPFEGTTTVQRVSLIRAGGPMWGQEHGALKVLAAKGPVTGLVASDLVIESPTFSGIQVQGPAAVRAAAFERIQIIRPGSAGILIAGTQGAASFVQVSVESPGGGGLADQSSGGFRVTRGDGNRGW
jgi:hypothetical protein